MKQKTLFGSTLKEKSIKALPPKKPPFIFLKMENGIDRSTCQGEAVSYLRRLSHEAVRQEKWDFLRECVEAEIILKSGAVDGATLAQKALLKRFSKK